MLTSINLCIVARVGWGLGIRMIYQRRDTSSDGTLGWTTIPRFGSSKDYFALKTIQRKPERATKSHQQTTTRRGFSDSPSKKALITSSYSDCHDTRPSVASDAPRVSLALIHFASSSKFSLSSVWLGVIIDVANGGTTVGSGIFALKFEEINKQRVLAKLQA